MRIWTSSLRKWRLMKRTRSTQQYFSKKVLAHCIVFGSGRTFKSECMKNVLGVGFPYQLSPSQRTKLSFPAVDFKAAAPGLMKMSNYQIKIFATTGVFFVTKFREISRERDYDTPLQLNRQSGCTIPTSNVGLKN